MSDKEPTFQDIDWNMLDNPEVPHKTWTVGYADMPLKNSVAIGRGAVCEPDKITFGGNGKNILALNTLTGDIEVHGRKITNDMEVVEALMKFLFIKRR